jgi:hypothetical protein
VNTIFVQIASYRDSELVPTVLDCINNAKYPKLLRFCIGWQHAGDEDISALKKFKNIKILDIPYTETKGACWVRHQIQKNYKDEKYTLQLDSHHRFVKDWDVKLIEMYNSVKTKQTPKPLLSSYIPSYQIKSDPQGRLDEVWQVNFDRFLPEGVVFLRPSILKERKTASKPVPARAISAHFIFTQGKWNKEVPYDPELYFHGEEISLGVRSFTHGYDLFHPHEIICWHHYTREGFKKHWDDHKDWDKLNSLSYKRVKYLLGVDGVNTNEIKFGKYGLGKKRTLDEFERYAGVDFKTRRFHIDSINEVLPTGKIRSVEEHKQGIKNWHKFCIDIYKGDVPETDYDFWCCVFKNDNNKDIYRQDLDSGEIHRLMNENTNDKFVHIWRWFYADETPTKWTVWPHSKSKEWNNRILENKIPYA